MAVITTSIDRAGCDDAPFPPKWSPPLLLLLVLLLGAARERKPGRAVTSAAAHPPTVDVDAAAAAVGGGGGTEPAVDEAAEAPVKLARSVRRRAQQTHT